MRDLIAAHECEFPWPDAQPRHGAPPLLGAMSGLLIEQAVVRFFNRDVAYAVAGFQTAVRSGDPATYVCFTAESAIVRLCSSVEYCAVALGHHLDLPIELKSTLKNIAMGQAARSIEFLPAELGTKVEYPYRGRSDATQALREVRRRKLVNASKGFRSIRTSLKAKYEECAVVDEIVQTLRDPRMEALRTLRNEFLHSAPLASPARIGGGALPGAGITFSNAEVDVDELDEAIREGHRAASETIALVLRIVRTGWLPAPPDATALVVRILECEACGSKTRVPDMCIPHQDENLGGVMCVMCGEVLDLSPEDLDRDTVPPAYATFVLGEYLTAFKELLRSLDGDRQGERL